MIKVQIQGLDAAIKQVGEKRIKEQLKSALSTYAISVDKEAKKLAPVNMGNLRASIYIDKTNLDNLEVSFVAGANYAAYVEFGTRKYAASYVPSLPIEWQDIAKEYKGKGSGGDFDDLVMALYEWAKKKGIKPDNPKKLKKDDALIEMAYFMAYKIMREGVPAQPFLYPAVTNNEKLLTDLIKSIE